MRSRPTPMRPLIRGRLYWEPRCFARPGLYWLRDGMGPRSRPIRVLPLWRSRQSVRRLLRRAQALAEVARIDRLLAQNQQRGRE